ncbi:MAG: putative peptidoglycan glycosyltransferase FtsW [Planctomycetota bacterium]
MPAPLESSLPDAAACARWIPRAAIVLLGLGLLLIHSGAAAPALAEGPGSPFFQKQLAYAIAGLLLMGLAAVVPPRLWRAAAPGLLAASALILVAVLAPGVGATVNGARRWFRLGGWSIQPSEFARIMLVLGLAATVAWTDTKGAFARTFLPAGLVVGFAGLVVVEPDVGGALLIGAVGVWTLWVAGRTFAVGVLSAGALALPAVAFLPGFEHVRTRIQIFLNPEADPLGRGYQIVQSIGAIASGGWTGVGLGEGMARHGYLPEHETDFLFATLTQELGFIGAAAALMLALGIVGLCLATAARAKDRFGALLAAGVGAAFGTAAALNVGVVCGVLPPKGLAFPLLSYGGSSLVAMMLGLGLVVSVAQEAARAFEAGAGANTVPAGVPGEALP